MTNNHSTDGKQMMLLHLLSFIFTQTFVIFVAIIWFVVYLSKDSGPAFILSEEINNLLLFFSGLLLIGSIALRGVIQKALHKNEKSFLIAHIVTLGIREGGVIIAFFVSFANHSVMPATYAAVVGIILNIITWPKKSDIVVK